MPDPIHYHAPGGPIRDLPNALRVAAGQLRALIDGGELAPLGEGLVSDFNKLALFLELAEIVAADLVARLRGAGSGR